MIKNYELMVLITPKINEEDAGALNELILGLIKEQGGELIKTDPWGRRMLAYQINKMQDAYYFVNYFKMESTSVKNVKKQININEKILRHMFIAKDE
jgi:small subunit ribosomal protein S6